MPHLILALTFSLLCCFPAPGAENASDSAPKILKSFDLSPVWSAHPVGFCLLTAPKHQFVAFYDAERKMCVASRALDSDDWQITRLPSSVVWDSHNSVTIETDKEGYLHVSGNMHVTPLIYFRSERPWDASSLRRILSMVGENEKRCTYPQFIHGASGELIFTYRDGQSGNGNQIYNTYDTATKTWKRLLDKPLTDGMNRMNAYFHGPVRGPDGVFHLCWTWRNSPACESNHDLSYARSRDLVHWERGDGTPLLIPITLQTAEIVDPVPPGGGMINGNTKIGFDSKGRTIITYHKYDANGFTQIHCARLEDGKWKTYQISDWNYRWDFHGGGTINFEISAGAVEPAADGTLTLSYHHAKLGSGTWRLNEHTLKIEGPAKRAATIPSELGKLESTFPGMHVRWCSDTGRNDNPGSFYILRWETLEANRDQPRPPPLPEPSMLRLYQVSK